MMEKIFGIDDELIYSAQNLAQGFLISAGLHGVFNIFLEMNWTFLLVPFLLVGYIYVNYLFEKKENNKKYGYLTTRDSPSTQAEGNVMGTINAIIG